MSSDKHNEEEFLRDLAPNLFNSKVDMDDAPPPGYFEALPDRVMSKISDLPIVEPKKGKVISLVNWRNIGIAAGLAILLGLGQTFNWFIPQSPSEISSQANSFSIPQDIELTDLDEYLEADMVYENYLLSDNQEDIVLNEALTEESILNYLLEENLSEELIIEELES